MNFFTLFFPPAQLKRMNEKGAGWVSCSQPKTIHHTSFLPEELRCFKQRMPVLEWDGHALGLCRPLTLSSGVSHVFSFCIQIVPISIDFWMVLVWFYFSFISLGLQQLPQCVYQATSLTSSSPPKDHFLHLLCKTMRIKVSSCLQSQQTVCMSNPFIFPPFSWWSLRLLSPFDFLLALLCYVRLSLVIGCPGLLHCMVQEAQETCS